MRSIYFRVPAAGCAIVCFVALLGSIRGGSRWWQPIFYAFLPVCFFYLGAVMLKMNREISRLRRRVARLEHRRRAPRLELEQNDRAVAHLS